MSYTESCVCVPETETEREARARAKSVTYSLACTSGQLWPRERQQRQVLEKVAAALTSSRAPVGSTEREGGSGPVAMLACRGGNS